MRGMQRSNAAGLARRAASTTLSDRENRQRFDE
jgi:hypothetical protein